MIKRNLSNSITIVISLCLFFAAAILYRRQASTFGLSTNSTMTQSTKPKIYWFIPDGFRADRGEFNIFEWANQGDLPNLKKMMDRGCRGYSWPVFPGHTPTNFATLMTGVLPNQHGIADGPMRIVGYPLNMVVKGGFSSFAKLVSPLWVHAEKSGYMVSLQSIPGSTPPELFRGNTIKGRWGAWGVDFPAIVFEDSTDLKLQSDIGQNKRVFTLGAELTRFVPSISAQGWHVSGLFYKNQQPQFEADLTNWDFPLFAGIEKEQVYFSSDKKDVLAILKVGEWSDWLPVTLKYQLKEDYQKNSPKKTELEKELSAVEVDTFMKIKVIRLSDGKFRFRILYDNLNEFMTSPSSLAEQLRTKIGPMTDFVDNYPPQLIYYPEDKKTFLEEADLSWRWHQSVVPSLVQDLQSDVVIHSIYTPNQMLTSRWWMPFVDSQSYRYSEKSIEERKVLKDEVKSMYQKADGLLGEILKATDQNWYVILSSDHGILPLHREIRLNNLFAEKGWLKYKKNKATQEFEIDWERTKVVYLQMNNIYIHTKGLAGPYRRDTSSGYLELRNQVRHLIESLEDPETHQKLASHIWNFENAYQAGLPQERVGDLILANSPQYNWSEDITDDQLVVAGTLKGGYKQGVWPKNVEGMLTPFVIAGPGIKQNCELSEVITHVDQFATVESILGIKAPYEIQGKVLTEIFSK